MTTLNELKRQRDGLNVTIKAMEKEAEKAERHIAIKTDYVKVVCPNCYGTGMISKGGADILSDPPWEDPWPGSGDLHTQREVRRRSLAD